MLLLIESIHANYFAPSQFLPPSNSPWWRPLPNCVVILIPNVLTKFSHKANIETDIVVFRPRAAIWCLNPRTPRATAASTVQLTAFKRSNLATLILKRVWSFPTGHITSPDCSALTSANFSLLTRITQCWPWATTATPPKSHTSSPRSPSWRCWRMDQIVSRWSQRHWPIASRSVVNIRNSEKTVSLHRFTTAPSSTDELIT